MPQILKPIIVSLCIILFSPLACADPWFTGPILAPAGHTVPRGHTNFEIYGIDVYNNGVYDSNGHINSIPLFKSVVLNPLLTHGFTDWLDVQIALPYAFNATRGVSNNRLADIGLGAGLQLVEQKKHKMLPDIRLFIQETFPTGKFEELNPAFLGTDATGLGSYRTLLAINFQYLAEPFESHYLRTRLMFSRQFSSAVDVMGFNSFGGSANTNGTVRPGSQDNIDLAFEFTVTQNWVAVMEGYYSNGRSTRFDGILDDINNGTFLPLADRYYELGLAPALEYNFTSNVGVIGGVWFPVDGKNTSHFISYVLALNAFW